MEKTKKAICVTIDRKLYDLIEINMVNRSKYIEWLIFQDMKKNNVDGIDSIII